MLTDLDNFLKNLLKYYNSDAVDLFLMTLDNTYQCRTVVYECSETNTWTNDLNNNKEQYEEVLHFAKTYPTHILIQKNHEISIDLQNLWIQKLR